MQVLQLHVVPTAAMAADLSDGQMLPTLGSLGNLTVSIAGGTVMIDAPKNGTSATVTDADNMAGAGVVHLIDGVLVPGDAAVPGLMGGAAAGGASMAPAPAGMNMTMTVDDTILAYVRNQDGLSTLAQLIETAGLADALNDPTSELTLFAPNNAAFAQLPPATLQALPTMTDLLAQVRLHRTRCRPLAGHFVDLLCCVQHDELRTTHLTYELRCRCCSCTWCPSQPPPTTSWTVRCCPRLRRSAC